MTSKTDRTRMILCLVSCLGTTSAISALQLGQVWENFLNPGKHKARRLIQIIPHRQQTTAQAQPWLDMLELTFVKTLIKYKTLYLVVLSWKYAHLSVTISTNSSGRSLSKLHIRLFPRSSSRVCRRRTRIGRIG